MPTLPTGPPLSLSLLKLGERVRQAEHETVCNKVQQQLKEVEPVSSTGSVDCFDRACPLLTQGLCDSVAGDTTDTTALSPLDIDR